MNTENADRSRKKRSPIFYGWWIVGSLFLTNFAVEATAIFSFAVFLKPMSEDLNISRGLISWVLAGRRLATGLASLLVGRLIDRYGSRTLITAAAALAGMAVIGLGWVQNAWQFLALFLLVGLSGITMPGNLLTSVPVQKWFVRQRGRATSFVTAGFGIGGMTFVIVHQQLIDAFGWRTAWVASGVFVIALVVPITWFIIKRQPEDMGLRPDGDPPLDDAPDADSGAPRAARSADDEVSWTERQALRTVRLWQILAAYVLISFAMGGLQVHRFAFWEDRGYDRSLIASSFSLDAGFFFVGILSAGFLVERFHVRFVGAYAMLIAVGGIAATILLDAPWVLFLSAVALGIGQGTNAVVQVHIWPTYFGRAHIGAIRGYIVPGIVIAQALGAPFAGAVFDATGAYLIAFWTAAVMVALAALLLLAAAQPRRPQPAPVPQSS